MQQAIPLGNPPEGPEPGRQQFHKVIRLSWQDKAYRIFCYVISVVWIFFVIFPIIWLFSSTFKDSVDVMKMPPDFLPRVPSAYTVQLDFSDVAAKDPGRLEQVIKEDLVIATWRVPDYLAAIHYGSITAEAYVNGRKVAYSTVPMYTYSDFRGRLWATQRLSDRLARREVTKALAVSDFQLNLSGMPSDSAGGTSEYTAQITKMFSAELKPTSRLITVGEKTYWPGIVGNFIAAWKAPGKMVRDMTYAGYMLNSLAVTLAAIFLQFIISGMAAYALSRILGRRASRLWTLFFLVTLMVPGIATLIPLYQMVGKLGIHDTLLGVIIPGIPGAFTIYLFKGFFDALPSEMFDAARIDGANEFQTFLRIAIPMSKNVFAVVGLLTFIGAWNDFFWPYLILRSPSVWTFPIAIFMTAGGSGAANASYAVAMASSVIAAVPTIVVFAIFSRSIQQGLVWSGLKG